MLNNSKYCYVSVTIQLNTSYYTVYTKLNDKIVLFLTIQLSLTKLNGSKYSYVSLTIQLNIRHLFTHS